MLRQARQRRFGLRLDLLPAYAVQLDRHMLSLRLSRTIEHKRGGNGARCGVHYRLAVCFGCHGSFGREVVDDPS